MPHEVRLHRPGLVAYNDAWRWQQQTAAAVRDGAPEALAILQHPPVYTLGRRARPENLLLDSEALARRGAEVVETDRGGDVTFHGPGQLVAYPILNLRARSIAPADYVRLLETTMLLTVQRFGINAGRVLGRPGLWAPTATGPLALLGRGSGGGAPQRQCNSTTLGTSQPLSAHGEGRTAAEERHLAKLGAVGVRVQNGVTTHGLALNVNVDLAWFDAIVPCGLPGITVTSIHQLLSHTPGLAAVEDALIAAFEHVFDLALTPEKSPLPSGERVRERGNPPHVQLRHARSALAPLLARREARDSGGEVPFSGAWGRAPSSTSTPELAHGR